ncbi:MAG: hypothetical protein WC554_01035 [Clostridia bacterium]|jgi:hypothetical protein
MNTETKHTPGPWVIAWDYDGGIYPLHTNPKAIPNGAAIYKPCIARAERRQDTRLIAAAPELLEACKYALIMCQNGHTAQEYYDCASKLKSAIAKAERGQE